MFTKMKKYRVAISLIIILICYSTGIGTSDSYADQKNKEYHIKAAFLLNFAKFMEWPSHAFSDPSTPLTLCILGKDAFDEALKIIEDKIVKERRLVIKKASCIEDIKESHILFVSTSEKKNLSAILSKINGLPILTVSETKNFCQSGGIVNFVLVKNKVRFEINVDAAKRTGLQISSKLLKLSKIIKER
jgi:hypothetical protein